MARYRRRRYTRGRRRTGGPPTKQDKPSDTAAIIKSIRDGKAKMVAVSASRRPAPAPRQQQIPVRVSPIAYERAELRRQGKLAPLAAGVTKFFRTGGLYRSMIKAFKQAMKTPRRSRK